jgi:hypothetical protein
MPEHERRGLALEWISYLNPRRTMTATNLIILIVVLFLLFGGGGYYYSRR